LRKIRGFAIVPSRSGTKSGTKSTTERIMARPSSPWYWREREGWYVTVGGKRKLLAKGPRAETRKAAREEFHRLMLARGRPVEMQGERMTVLDVFDLYLDHAKGQAARGEKEQDTYSAYKKFLVSASKSIGSIRVAEVQQKDFLRWVDRPTWKSTMRHSALTVAKLAFGWAKTVGHVRENPLAGMEMPRPNVRTAIPTKEQVEKILAAAWGQPFRDFLLALRETGCRPSEIMTLTSDRVNLGAGTWQVRNKTRWKTGEDHRTVYLTPAVIELTGRLMEKRPQGLVFRNSQGRPWKKGPVAYRFRRLQRKLGYGPECTAYAFRHLYITDALERGVNPATVAELVGHKDLTMIMRVYSKLGLRKQHLSDAASLIRPSEPPRPTPLR
jgi:integrase